MKVLHLSHWGWGGAGGAMGTRRLHFGLRKVGVDSLIVCARNGDEPSQIIQFRRSRTDKLLDALLRKATWRLGLNNLIDLSSFKIAKTRTYVEADVVNIHNFTGFFSYLALPRLTEDKPTVLSLADMWTYTGHCYASFDCERWKTGCGSCPYPDVFWPIRRDGTHVEWKLKNWAYSRSHLSVVTLSTKHTEQARQSMLGCFPIYHIPYGIDTEVYKPLDPAECRSLLGIPPGKKVLMFMAKSLNSPVKGWDLLSEALRSLPRSLKAEAVLLLLGNDGRAFANSLDIQTIDFGFVGSDRIKAICYSASDLFVHPTRADAFGWVLLESMACGTPLVSFRVGGVPDLVRPGLTGYLAEPGSAKDLADGIVQLLEDKALRLSMREQCRTIASKEYSLELMVQRYVDLYRQVLQSRKGTVADTMSPTQDVNIKLAARY